MPAEASGSLDDPLDEPLRSPRLRASDSDRHAAVRRIQDGVARGLLGFDEGGERLTAAWASRYLDEVERLTTDLPSSEPPPVAAPGWSALAALATAQLRQTLLTRPTGSPRLNRLAAVAIAGVAICVVIALAAVQGLFPEHHDVDVGGFSGGPADGNLGGGTHGEGLGGG